MAQLSVRDLKVRYGKTEILHGASFEVAGGEIVALLGANGSGKSTALNAVSGFVKPVAGSIRLDGEELAGQPTHFFFQKGVVQISQSRDLFPEMTVHENIALGMAMCRRDLDRTAQLAKVYAIFPHLNERRHAKAQTLSGGEQQMIAVARALVSEPRVLLLDEPSGGLAPRVVEEIAVILRSLKERGHTMVLVEQNVFLATAVADRFYILRDGIVTAGDAIMRHTMSEEELVRAVYL